MADRQREVIWTFQSRTMLDEAVGYIAQDSLTTAQQLLIDALDAGASLTTLSEHGRTVPELEDPNTRELFVQRYRLIYEVHPTEIHILGFARSTRLCEVAARDPVKPAGVTGIH